MAKRDCWDIQPAAGEWEVKREGRNRATRRFDRKQDAVKFGHVPSSGVRSH